MPVNLTAYAEYGAVGIIIILFIGMIKFLQTSLTAKLSSVETICIKLIDPHLHPNLSIYKTPPKSS